jgi:hypothetical protein
VNKVYTRSCNMLKYFTLDVTTSRCIVLNRCSRNYSILNLKIEFSKLTHWVVRCIVILGDSGITCLMLEGPNWVLRRWR